MTIIYKYGYMFVSVCVLLYHYIIDKKLENQSKEYKRLFNYDNNKFISIQNMMGQLKFWISYNLCMW